MTDEPESRWVLVDEREGKKLWFQMMTGIGPMSTPDRGEAAEFPSRQAAMSSPAYKHVLSLFEPVEETT